MRLTSFFFGACRAVVCRVRRVRRDSRNERCTPYSKVFGTTDNDAVIRKILSEGDWPKEKGFNFMQHKNQKTMKKEK